MKQDLSGIKHILLDIEGTICPISFVKDKLFPYALKALPNIVSTKWDDPEFGKYKSGFPNECQETQEKFIEHVRDLSERNIKIAYFKDLQGYLWEEGYESGAYSSPFFDDVVPALRRWKKAGVDISSYSSGSVFAQKLLFGHVKFKNGADESATLDLKPLVTDWFDTTDAGSKMESRSYMDICKALEVLPEDVVFLSDNVKELHAAKEANMKVALVVREGNDEVSSKDRERFQTLEVFDRVDIGTDQKSDHEDQPEHTGPATNGQATGSGKKERKERDGTSEVRGDAEVKGPANKKQRTAHARAKVAEPSSQRRSKRLQKPTNKV